MPQEAGYQPQVAPGAPVGLPQASPATFGAGIGQAVEQLGDVAHNAKLRAYQLERQQAADSEAADFNARFAKVREAADKWSIDARNGAAPGGTGHADAAGQWWQQQAATLADGITDDRVRRSAAAQLEEFGGRFRGGEYQWQEGARIGKVVTDTTATTTSAANRAYSQHDPHAFATELSIGRQAIEAMPGVPEDVRAKLVKQHDQLVSASFLNGIVDTNPKAVKPILDSGQFDDILSPEQMDRLRNGADVEVRRQDAIVAHQAALAKSQAHEAISTLNARVASGETIPDADFAAGEAQARAIGDDSSVVSLHAARIKSGVNRQTQAWTPQQYQTEIQRLRGKGEKRTADEDIYLNQLEDIATKRTEEFRKDPGSWSALNGNPPPVLTIHDPASVAARRQWQAAVSRTTGLPTPFLQPQEVANYQARIAESPRERLGVVNELGNLGGMTAVYAARQVAPDDVSMAREVLLRPGDRAAVSNGKEARKANPGLIDGHGANTPGGQAFAAFQKRVGPAAALMGQSDVGAAFEVARNLYADWAVKNGVQAFKPDTFGAFVHRALGGTKDAQGQYHGGVGTWNGANVLLPPRLSQGQFDATLSRMGWHADWADAPRYRNGQAMTAAEVRKYTPVARPDGRYEFHGPGNVALQNSDGSLWTLDLDALAKRMHL